MFENLVLRTADDEAVTLRELFGQPLLLIFLRHLA
jgi:hypothetical protein